MQRRTPKTTPSAAAGGGTRSARVGGVVPRAARRAGSLRPAGWWAGGSWTGSRRTGVRWLGARWGGGSPRPAADGGGGSPRPAADGGGGSPRLAADWSGPVRPVDGPAGTEGTEGRRSGAGRTAGRRAGTGWTGTRRITARRRAGTGWTGTRRITARRRAGTGWTGAGRTGARRAGSLRTGRRWVGARWTALAVLALTLAALFTAPAAQAAPVLLSQGRPVTASSTESGAFPASAAVDGDAGTRWSSAFGDPQWLQVDLGSTQQLSQVVLTWEAAYAKAFTIQASADGATWTSLYSTTTATGGSQTLNVTGSGRYVRLTGTQRATQYGYSLWEFQVYGGGGTTQPGDALLSYGKSGTASSYQDDGACPGCLPAKAFDHDPATRWATSATTGWVDPGWITVDLGATAAIHQVVLQWDPAYAVAYQIQVSNDNANWTSLYSTTSGKGFKETLTVNGSGRYVRMYGTARSNGYGYSLWGFDVYGTGGNPTPPPPVPPAPHFPGTLVWSDEFNGAAGANPDASKWTAETGAGVNNELEYYTNNNNAKQDGRGNLVIQVRREATPGSACPVDPVSGSGTCQYTSGRINTAGKFSFTYGHVEANIKVSGTQGLWPAFWLLGANFFSGTPWPNCGEIDIMEHVGKSPNLAYSTIHAPAYNGAGGIGAPLDLGQDVAAGFHKFGLDWDASHMTFYVDGNAFETINRDTVESTRGPWVYDHPFFLILNNAIGGDFPGPPGAGTVLPQDMVIDYVRVYQ